MKRFLWPSLGLVVKSVRFVCLFVCLFVCILFFCYNLSSCILPCRRSIIFSQYLEWCFLMVSLIRQMLGPIKHGKTLLFYCGNKYICYIAGNFFPTARALIDYFEVTWHLTLKLLPAKISERATLQNLWHHRVTVHCYPRMLTSGEIYFHNFVHEKVFFRGLYNKSLKDWFLGKQFIVFPSHLNVPLGSASGNEINCFPLDQSLSV